MLVEVLLADQPVAAARDAGVGREYDNGVRRVRRFFQRIEHAADQGVEVGNIAVILGDHLAHSRRRAGMRQEDLVADEHLAVVERMLRQEVLRQRDLGRVVADRERVGDDMRIVRRIERYVAEERFVHP